ncbi:hypothetical protein [Adlercreutzia equolifaciens]|uniref:hypothetical protein n=1 Tax=Adlercreutzia equolifaciens TaxID=446660 RepID=UPI003A8E5703
MNERQRLAHQWLRTYQITVHQVDSLVDAYAAAQSRAMAITAAVGEGGGSSSPSEGRFQNAANEMLELSEKLSVQADELAGQYERQLEVVRAVAERNCLHGEILQCLYIEGLSCAECRRWLARDRRHEYAASSIYKLRDRALDRAFDAMVELGYR